MLTRIKAASKKLYFRDAIHKSKNSPQKTWEVLNELLVGKKSHSLNHQYWMLKGNALKKQNLEPNFLIISSVRLVADWRKI